MARPATDIESRIVRAARVRFLAEGVDGASLRMIARDAKTNLGMIFYYFPTKDDLFLAAVDEVYANLVLDLASALEGGAPLADRLVCAFTRVGAASDDESQVIRLVIRESLLSSTRFDKVFARARRGHLMMLLRVLAEGVAAGELDGAIPLPMLLVCTLALGGLPQLIRRAAGDKPPFSALPKGAALAKSSVEILLRGAGAKKAGMATRAGKPKRGLG
ncbi:MAG: TetR/AcrR family transcriptional regulator, partial [Polyangiaceae bacterium]